MVIYPGHEDAIEALTSSGEGLPADAMLPFPQGEPLAALRDKRRIGELAERAGLDAPTTRFEGLACSVEPAQTDYPCVVKPARTRVGLPSAGIASDPLRLSELLAAFPPDEEVVVQELLQGPLVCLAVVVDRDGRLVARFQQQGLRTWPREGGLISRAVSVAPDDGLAQRVAAMLADVGYYGLVQLDLVAASGGPVLIDANPRFYASMSLALASGVNLPAAWHGVVTGDRSSQPEPYSTGIRFRWLEADLKDAVLGRPRSLLWRGSAPAVGAAWDRQDPVPAALLALGSAAAISRNRLQRRSLFGNAGLPVHARRQSVVGGLPLRPAGRQPRQGRVKAMAQSGPPRLELLETLHAVHEEWASLAEEGRNVFATPEWSQLWWKHFGGDHQLLAVSCCLADGRLVGVLPLYLWRLGPVRVIRFIGHEAGDELGPVCAAADRPEVAKAARSILERSPAPLMIGQQLPCAAGWGRLLGARTLGREGSLVLALGYESWDGFLATRSSNFRGQIRGRERKLARHHAIGFRLADDPARFGADLDTLFALHRAAHPARSSFSCAEPFHREWASLALERGWCRLWLLEVDGVARAAWYGFRFNGTEAYYQSGRDPAWDAWSVGSILLAHSVREALCDGMSEYRFLRGGEEYKRRFGGRDDGLETVALAFGRTGDAALLTAAVVRRLRKTRLWQRVPTLGRLGG